MKVGPGMIFIRALTLGLPHAVVVLAKGMSILLNVVRTHEGGTNEVRHSKAAQEFRLLRHELLLGENIFLAQFREAFDCLHNVFHGERSRGSRSGCWRGGRGGDPDICGGDADPNGEGCGN